MFLQTYTPNPVAFSVFGLEVMWYGILIGLGMILAGTLTYVRAPKHKIPKDRIIDILIFAIPAGIIGARFYYVIFNWDNYAGQFLHMLNLREGGLAVHGGLIFGILAGLLLCLRWSIKPLNALDLAAPGIALAQSIGRWGNYFNMEAHGGPTNLPWAIPVDGVMVHPTFLYESLWCFVLFLFLLFMDNHRKFQGQIILLYGILYSLERFFVEGLRTDSLMIGPFRQAQVLSLCVIVVCLLLYRYFSRRKGRKF